jgi:hypothetical protein
VGSGHLSFVRAGADERQAVADADGGGNSNVMFGLIQQLHGVGRADCDADLRAAVS